MIDNDNSTIIEAPEVYKSTTTPSRVQNQRKTYQKKMLTLTLSMDCYGQFY